MRLEVSGLRKSYGSVAVLRGVDLVVEGGRVLYFLGANRAGKSTLLNCMSGTSLRGLGPRQVQDQGGRSSISTSRSLKG